jgi:hypothetical protein
MTDQHNPTINGNPMTVDDFINLAFQSLAQGEDPRQAGSELARQLCSNGYPRWEALIVGRIGYLPHLPKASTAGENAPYTEADWEAAVNKAYSSPPTATPVQATAEVEDDSHSPPSPPFKELSFTPPTPLEAVEKLKWSIVPLKLDKKPHLKEWGHLQQRRPTAEEISKWVEKYKKWLSCWALVTGAVSKRFTLDFDGPEGLLTMRTLGLRPLRRTPSGGYHVDFAHPGFPIKTERERPKEGKPRTWPGMDVRGDGGYSVYAGRAISKHSNPPVSGDYVWLRDPNEAPYPFDILPPGLQEYLRKTEPHPSPIANAKSKSKPNGKAKRVDSELLIRRALTVAPSCGRNNSGFDLACQLRDNAYSRSEALSILDDYRTRCASTNTKGSTDPYTAQDARASVEQAFSRAAREPWGDKKHDQPSETYITSSDVADVTGPKTTPDDNWRDTLLLNDEGKTRACLANILLALRHSKEWCGTLGFNEFSLEVVTRKTTPWRGKAGHVWTDSDDSLAAEWMQRNGIFVNSSKTVGEAVQVVAREKPFHPLRERIDALMWDGTPRLDTWLIKYLGAKDTTYTRAVGKRWMISLIARLYQPGCKADYVLMLEGPQGKLKSTVFAIIVGDEYFTDRLSDMGGKDCMLEMAGMWLIELGEIENYLHDARSRNRFKSFITSRIDYFREPYARRPVAHLRHCILAATTNSTKTLADPTGTRRIWPIECGQIDIDALRKDADQLLAEGKVCFDNANFGISKPRNSKHSQPRNKRNGTSRGPGTASLLTGSTTPRDAPTRNGLRTPTAEPTRPMCPSNRGKGPSGKKSRQPTSSFTP